MKSFNLSFHYHSVEGFHAKSGFTVCSLRSFSSCCKIKLMEYSTLGPIRDLVSPSMPLGVPRITQLELMHPAGLHVFGKSKQYQRGRGCCSERSRVRLPCGCITIWCISSPLTPDFFFHTGQKEFFQPLSTPDAAVFGAVSAFTPDCYCTGNILICFSVI